MTELAHCWNGVQSLNRIKQLLGDNILIILNLNLLQVAQ